MPTRVCKYAPNKECTEENPPSDLRCIAKCFHKGHTDTNYVPDRECLEKSPSVDHIDHNSEDKILRPSHYVEGRKYEPKDVIRDWGLNYNLGCAVKYISRAGRKDDILQDLRKARTYLSFEIDALEEEK